MILATGLYINAWCSFIHNSVFRSLTVEQRQGRGMHPANLGHVPREVLLLTLHVIHVIYEHTTDGASWSSSGTSRLVAILIFGHPLLTYFHTVGQGVPFVSYNRPHLAEIC
jgi:hypothetical protein